MDDEPVIDKPWVERDEVIEKFKVAYDLKLKAVLLQHEADAKQKLADELHVKAEYHRKQARFWVKVRNISLGVAFASLAFNLITLAFNLISHYLRTHP